MRRISWWALWVGSGLALGLVASWGVNRTIASRVASPVVEDGPGQARSSAIRSPFLGQPQLGVAAGDAVPGEGLLQVGQRGERDVRAAVERAGLTLFAYDPRLGAARVGLPEGETLRGVAPALRAAGLPAAQPNHIAHATKKPSALVSAADLEPVSSDATSVAAAAPGYQGVPGVVAILDTGVRAVATFGPNVHILRGYDFVNEDDDASDDNQHGTHLASIVSDVADERARILPVKVLDASAHGTEFDVARGIRWAVEQGADVINLSLAFPPSYAPGPTLLVALEAAFENDVVVVASAGNWGTGQIAYPAAFSRVIGVGAEYQGVRAPYSCYGAALDLLAPGGGPNLGEGILGDTFALNDPDSEQTVDLSGTSMAAAHVSGVAAMLRGANPDLTAREVRGALVSTADGSWAFDPETGDGVLNGAAALVAAQDPTEMGEVVVLAQPFQEQQSLAQCTGKKKDREACLLAAQTTRLVVLVEVLDEALAPLHDVKVFGDISGTIEDSTTCRTDGHGRCLMSTAFEGYTVDKPAAFAVRVGRIQLDDGSTRVPMAGFRANPDRAARVVEALRAEEPGVVVDRIEARVPSEDSVLAGRAIQSGYSYSPVYNPNTHVLMNDAYFDQVEVARRVHVVDEALRLGSEGEGEPLVWLNDVPDYLLAEGEGLWGSGMQPTLNLYTWNVGLMYDTGALGSGAGLWGSGMLVGDYVQPWLLTSAPTVDAGYVLGNGLWGSGMMPSFNLYSYSLQTAMGLSLSSGDEVDQASASSP